MRFHSFPASWRSGPSRSRRLLPRPARRGTRPVLEQLDERVLLTTYSAASVSDLIVDINASNKAGGANTINLTAPTTSPYVLTAVNNTTNGGNGLPVITQNDNLTIVGNGDTIERSTVSAGFRLFDVAAGASLTLQKLTLQGGLAKGLNEVAEGGAIENQGALTLSGVTVQSNIARDFGFLWPNRGVPAYGGGIWSNGSLTLENGTLLEDNQANGSPAGGPIPAGAAYGGALYVAGGTANITNTTFSFNRALAGSAEAPILAANAYGGALYVAAGQVVLTTTTVTNNVALATAGGRLPGYGGGLFIAIAATVDIDAFTLANTINNTAAIDPNIDGTYIET